MIRRPTIVYIVLLLALVGAYYYLNNRAKTADAGATATAEPSAEVTYLFSAEQGTPSSIRLESKSGRTVEVARGADKAWELVQPVQAKADQAIAEEAATQATNMRIMDSVPNVDPKVVGLEVPEYVLTIKFTSGAEKSVDIGILAPTQIGYYVRDAAGKIVIVSKNGVDPLLQILDNPPYAETPTPSPAPVTETAAPEAVTPPSSPTAAP